MVHPGLLLIIMWSKIIQMIGTTHVLQLPEVRRHSADSVTACIDLLVASLTTHPNQPLLPIGSGRAWTVVTIFMPVNALRIMWETLQLDTTLYSLQSLRRGDAISAYQAGIDQIDIKHPSGCQTHLWWQPWLWPCPT